MPKDALNTLPTSIIHAIVDRVRLEDKQTRYTPSHIAAIINKSIGSNDRHSYDRIGGYGARKGHYSHTNDAAMWMDVLANYNFGDGTEITYKNMVFPGFAHGEEIMTHLDRKVNEIMSRKLNMNQSLRLAALVATIISSSHTFPDANGRTAVGTADVMLQILTGKRLDIKKIMREDDKLTNHLTTSTFFLLPDAYHPNSIHQEMVRSGTKTKEIVLPQLSTDSFRTIFFLYAFKESIIEMIDGFDVDSTSPARTDFKDDMKNNEIFLLANLFKKCLAKDRKR